jgi:thiosulfate dehydrogenase (quinone) large subunit
MAATDPAISSPARADTGVRGVDTADRAHDNHAHLWPIRIAALLIGLLWFTQILWKLPWDNFGSPNLQPNPTITAEQPGPFIDNGQGLYHWISEEARHGNWLVPFYGDLIKNVALPNWQLVGWLTFFMESFIAISLIFGLLSRLGGLVSFVQGINLFLGLAQAPNEWEWTYVMLFTLGFIFMMTGPGRVWGIDSILRPRLREGMSRGNGLARLIYRAT